MPRFSWDTVQPFYHSCNESGAFSEEALAVITKFPIVTIEKGQGLNEPRSPGHHAEAKILAALRSVKEADKNISTVFYYNSVLDWTMYDLHEKLVARPDLWLRDAR